jgi:hypothetical protein
MLLFLNIALFISANASIGASVYMRLTFGEDEIWLPSLFDFTLANSVRDMWNAGKFSYQTFILYLKPFCTFYCFSLLEIFGELEVFPFFFWIRTFSLAFPIVSPPGERMRWVLSFDGPASL